MTPYTEFAEKTRPFVEWMLNWYDSLPTLPASEVFAQPEAVGMACIDIIKGFTTVGPLASPRINATVPAIASLFERGWAAGVREMILLQDSHPENAVEFGQYAPHCITGTEEAEAVDALAALPFFDQMTIVPKNCINPGVVPAFGEWLAARPNLHTFVVMGDCSDICTYQLAMFLRTRANQTQDARARVIAPVSTIDTYHLPVETALSIGATPHDADFLHLTFLYSMYLNGVEVVRGVA